MISTNSKTSCFRLRYGPHLGNTRMTMLPSYVLITPARNEAQFIELTIRSVIAQSARPLKWVIVSAGSTDGTDEIVRRYATEHSWIELVRTPERRERHFAAKVHAFSAGYLCVGQLNYDVIASLDADISFDDQYFAYLLGKIAEDPRLGLVGTPFIDDDGTTYDYRYVNREHVSGACQVFRRECFETIGGYTPVKGGGIDYLAVVKSRMKGWRTRTFTDKVCHHHRLIGTAGNTVLYARFKYGMKDYAFGNHPLWQCFRTTYQMTRKPIILGGGAVMAGYIWAMIRRVPRPVSPQLVAFVRREQMERLKAFFQKTLLRRFASNSKESCSVVIDKTLPSC
jgi:poly-beta-1,6-N-acetyl-D-glucosamine synthase